MSGIKEKITNSIVSIVYQIGRIYVFFGNLSLLLYAAIYYKFSKSKDFSISNKSTLITPDNYSKIILSTIISFTVIFLGLYLIHKSKGISKKITLYLAYIYFLIGISKTTAFIFDVLFSGGRYLSHFLMKEEVFPFIIGIFLSFLGGFVIFNFNKNNDYEK